MSPASVKHFESSLLCSFPHSMAENISQLLTEERFENF